MADLQTIVNKKQEDLLPEEKTELRKNIPENLRKEFANAQDEEGMTYLMHLCKKCPAYLCF